MSKEKIHNSLIIPHPSEVIKDFVRYYFANDKMHGQFGGCHGR